MLGGGGGGGAAGAAGGGGGFSSQETSAAQFLHSISAVDSADHKGLKVSSPVPVGVQQQQNQQLLLTPAGLQLAQLQAQLTLQRLKLAQGGNAGSAASVLNQVLSNVAMSQPLFNQLRTPGTVGNPQGAFHTAVVGFPPSSSPYGALLGGGLTHNQATVRVNHPGQAPTVGQHGTEYGTNSGSAFPTDTDRRLPVYNLAGASPAASPAAAEDQYSVVNTQANSLNSLSLHRDYSNGRDTRQHSGFGIGEQTINVYDSSGHHERQWKGHMGLSERLDAVPSTASMWTAAGQTIRGSGAELYKPEEPTSDSKLSNSSNGGDVSSFGPSGAQGFGHFQPLHGTEETLSAPTKTLQPYQVNDYHAVTPTQLPHQCSICSKKVYNLKDWDQHVKGKLHLQNKMQYTAESSAGAAAGATAHYAAGGPADGGLSCGGTSSMVYSAACQDALPGASSTSSYLPGAAMKTFPLSQDPGFAPHQLESKPFTPRKPSCSSSSPSSSSCSPSAGRVVHICNLPEGSCTEADVVHLGLPFGKVTNYILMRSTHQAFLEMAYVEAAKAMVQFYQLSPATINGQKLLIRMSKRYRELQLKKPGKDVQSIIQDLSSQWGREEQQELLEHYPPERTRSRSPISRSLSPHSPAFNPCGSNHSPQGRACRGSNGLGPRRGSWDWSRRPEEERSREEPWRSGGEERLGDRRSAEHRKAEGGGSRDWHPRGSPQGAASYPCHEPAARALYQRYEGRARRREGAAEPHDPRDLHDPHGPHGRSRHLHDYQEGQARRSEERGRNKRWSRRHCSDKAERPSREKSASPKEKSRDASGSSKDVAKEEPQAEQKEQEEQQEEEDEGDGWYPSNMEELLTVDEVGEDEPVPEPDLEQLEQEQQLAAQQQAEQQQAEQQQAEQQQVEHQQGEHQQGATQQQAEQQKASPIAAAPPPGLEVQEASRGTEQQQPQMEETSEADRSAAAAAAASSAASTNHVSEKPQWAEPPASPPEEPKASLEEAVAPEEEQLKSSEGAEVQVEQWAGQQVEAEPARHAHKESSSLKKEIEAPSPSGNQDKVIGEHSIPLGVEFVVPQTGFYCQLCRLFYSSENAAKSAHCRSTVHYRNLQKYLMQLAEVEAPLEAQQSGDGSSSGSSCSGSSAPFC